MLASDQTHRPNIMASSMKIRFLFKKKQQQIAKRSLLELLYMFFYSNCIEVAFLKFGLKWAEMKVSKGLIVALYMNGLLIRSNFLILNYQKVNES